MVKSSEITQKKNKARYELIESQPDPFRTIIWNAIYENATDIHLNAVEGGTLILYRVDGIIHEKRLLTETEGRQLINQLKTAAKLNATKSFMPQEGQIKWPDDETLRDIRVTVVPAGKNAESAHMRILSFPQDGWQISKLGLSEGDLQNVSSAINSMNGLVLVSGATGSGKTTSMYSFASLADLKTKMAFSIEDPVEFHLPYAQQLEVDDRHGLTMYQGLQTILRMDPDLVMVGEIRDRDSAIVTSRAALSGRLGMPNSSMTFSTASRNESNPLLGSGQSRKTVMESEDTRTSASGDMTALSSSSGWGWAASPDGSSRSSFSMRSLSLFSVNTSRPSVRARFLENSRHHPATGLSASA